MMDWEKLKTLKTSASSRATMLDILGVSRREIYITKAYEYFLNPHGGFPYYKEFAKIFFEEYGEKANGFLDEYSVQSEYVLFEDKEHNGKEKQQIDLVFFSKGKAIIVENKIDAWLYNDLEKYQEWLKSKLGLSEVFAKVLSFHSSQGMTHASICKRAKLEMLDNIQSSENQLHLFQFSEFIEHMIKLSNAMGTQEDFHSYTSHIKEINNALEVRNGAFLFFRSMLREIREELHHEVLELNSHERSVDLSKEKDYAWMHVYTRHGINGVYLTIVYNEFWSSGGKKPIILIVESRNHDHKVIRAIVEEKYKQLNLKESSISGPTWRHHFALDVMITDPSQMKDAIYNAAKDIFEAVVGLSNSLVSR